MCVLLLKPKKRHVTAIEFVSICTRFVCLNSDSLTLPVTKIGGWNVGTHLGFGSGGGGGTGGGGGGGGVA